MSDTKWDAARALELADDPYRYGPVSDMLRAAVAHIAHMSSSPEWILRETCDAHCQVIQELEAELDRLAADNAGLRDSLRAIGELDLASIRELCLARACVEAAKSVCSEDDMREALTCYVMGVELIGRLTAYDAHVAAKGET